MKTPPVIVWIRRDLRLYDNPALYHATQYDAPILPVFVWHPEEEAPWAMGGAQKWWLHYSLIAFKKSLAPKKVPFLIKKGPSASTLIHIIEETGASIVLWNKAYEPAELKRDQDVCETLQERGVEVRQLESQLLHDPNEIRTGKGDPYKVYTPFWKNVYSTLEIPPPLSEPEFPIAYELPSAIDICPVDELQLLPRINWAEGIREAWTPGEHTARERLSAFADSAVYNYEAKRDIPSIDGTSRLSPHLHFGEISSRTIWHQVIQQADDSPDGQKKLEPYLKQLIWREFSYHLLYHFPETAENNMRASFDKFPWEKDKEMLKRWQEGQTGYPIVDAGMRQLWATGWMHNRVRMVVASFLTKHLLIHWIEGAKWFWDTLVDANLANNTMGWQWSAGSGADAQPFFRIFNPISQSKKFDPDGDYIKCWIPELKKVPAGKIHEPWLLSSTEQQKASVKLGASYPMPVVEHKEARERALDAYKAVSK